MRIALVGPELEENLALRYLHASLVEAGHEARIFDFSAPAEADFIVRHLLAYAPQIVGLSMVFTGRAREFVGLARALREQGYTGHITAGGHFASFHAERLLADAPALDSIVHGEGETAIVELADHLGSLTEVAGLSYRAADGAPAHTGKRTVCPDLAELSWPTRTPPFHAYLGIPIANMLGSRGCFGTCNFCSISAWYKKTGGPRFRQRAVTDVAAEMTRLYHEHGVRIFNFHDDNFFLPSDTANHERFTALNEALVSAGVHRIAIQVKARPDSITPEIVACLKEAGLFRVFLGVETNAVAGLRTLGRGIRREQNHAALQILEKAGIHATFNLLMFDPETSLDDLGDNLEFIEAYARFPLNFGRVEVYTGTPLEERLRDENRLNGDYFGYSYEIREPRVERAFRIFKRVFTPRNFDDGALNLEGMKLDYLLHLLAHFHPGSMPSSLVRECRSEIEGLNLHSAGLLRAIRDYTAKAPLADRQGEVELAFLLAGERDTYDSGARRRMAGLFRRLEDQGAANKKRSFAANAAAVAAAAIVISVSGCRDADKNRHMHEMMPQPVEELQPTTNSARTPKQQTPVEPGTNVVSPTIRSGGFHMCEMIMRPMEPNK